MNLILTGDCLEMLSCIADASVDAVVTDPPYGLSDHRPEEVLACLTAWIQGKTYRPKGRGFMGREWDAWVPGPEVWREVLRVMKPGAHALVFAGTRSMDLMSMALRLAGFELRDAIGHAHEGGMGAPLAAWVYGSGFPKSLNVARAIDKREGATHEVVGTMRTRAFSSCAGNRLGDPAVEVRQCHRAVLAPASERGKAWEGWGTALKPAWEPILIARKPLDGGVAENVLRHDTGAMNVGACRVLAEERLRAGAGGLWSRSRDGKTPRSRGDDERGGGPEGRWPANVIHDGSEAVVAAFPESPGQRGAVSGREPSAKTNRVYRPFGGRPATSPRQEAERSAARFFYCAKASAAERAGSLHPTVKPLALMRYLVRLVTPLGGVVLDPYAGTGTTLEAAMLEGCDYLMIERDPDFVADILRRRERAASALHGRGAEEDGREVAERPMQAELDLGVEHG